jgi:hypothetical protein
MAHVQQQILEGVRDALIVAETIASTRVFLDRMDRLSRSDLPAILITEASDGETIEPATVSSQGQRVYSVQISCVVTHSRTHAADARELGAEVERIVGAAGFAVPKPGRSRLAATRITADSESEVPYASLEQLWRFTYLTRRGAPDVAL